MKRRWVWVTATAALCACFSTACERQRTTPEQCGDLLDRIVEIELHEQGFRDPALAQRKKSELRRALAPQLARCAGRPVRPEALACMRNARSTEELSHTCLR